MYLYKIRTILYRKVRMVRIYFYCYSFQAYGNNPGDWATMEACFHKNSSQCHPYALRSLLKGTQRIQPVSLSGTKYTQMSLLLDCGNALTTSSNLRCTCNLSENSNKYAPFALYAVKHAPAIPHIYPISLYPPEASQRYAAHPFPATLQIHVLSKPDRRT